MNDIKNLTTLNPPALGSIEAYTRWAYQIPSLSAEEEISLATKLQAENDLLAARKLVLAHLKFVVKIANSYFGYGLPQADLIQEGNIGLMKAVKKFNPKLGVRLVSFAIHWIKAEIHEYIIKNWRIVKIATTKAQRKLFFNLRKMSKSLKWLNQSETEAIAKELKVTTKDVTHMEATLQKGGDVALYGSSDDEAENWNSPIHYLEDQNANPEILAENENWEETQKSNLQEAIAKLDHRSQNILAKRFLAAKKTTLEELATTYKISAERVRQLEQNALQKLRNSLQNVVTSRDLSLQ
jgi:RNA polymerase sigma-32 factor